MVRILVEIDRCVKGAYCLKYQDDETSKETFRGPAYTDDGGRTHLWNVSQFLPDYVVQQPRKHLVFNSLKYYLHYWISKLNKQRHISRAVFHHVLNEATAFNAISTEFQALHLDTSVPLETARIWTDELTVATVWMI
jgi:uncharacterized protein Usg